MSALRLIGVILIVGGIVFGVWYALEVYHKEGHKGEHLAILISVVAASIILGGILFYKGKKKA
jgi:prolipoprotein diacylglyceryltransferase